MKQVRHLPEAVQTRQGFQMLLKISGTPSSSADAPWAGAAGSPSALSCSVRRPPIPSSPALFPSPSPGAERQLPFRRPCLPTRCSAHRARCCCLCPRQLEASPPRDTRRLFGHGAQRRAPSSTALPLAAPRVIPHTAAATAQPRQHPRPCGTHAAGLCSAPYRGLPQPRLLSNAPRSCSDQRRQPNNSHHPHVEQAGIKEIGVSFLWKEISVFYKSLPAPAQGNERAHEALAGRQGA